MMIKQDILIVEDEILSAKFLKNILNKLGHNIVRCVATGNEALGIFKKEKIDFVFMDLNLEGAMDGILCAKKLNDYREVPIIYVTGFGKSEIIEEASETNIYGYLIKPFDERDIEAVLSVAIHRVNDMLNFKNKHKEVENRAKIDLGNGYVYDLEQRILMLKDNEIRFSKNENRLLDYLCLNSNQHISYGVLIENIWKNKKISFSAIRDTILRIRKKAPELNIENIVGVGYCLRKKI